MSHPIVNYLKKQSFQPGLLSLFTNPFYFIRSSLYKGIKSESSALQGKLLDFGCGRKPYLNLFTVSEYIGVDMEQTGHDHALSEVDIYYDGKTIPFPDSNFDAVFCGEVIEHIFEPDAILSEINRVMRPGALILLTVPFCWNEHEVPFDYARYSSFGIRALLEKNFFKVVHVKKTGSFARVIFQLWALYFFELFKKGGRFGYLLSLIFIVPINLSGSLVLLFLPRNDSLYFNNIVLAQKQA